MRNYEIDLPALPASQERKSHPVSDNQFTRRKLQGLLHIMTAELKVRGTKTPHIFLPFRSRVNDTKITLFLRRLFPGGVMVDTSNKAIVRSLLDDFDEFTLICGLKYLWCRLPNNEVIGWEVYLEFKRKEMEAGYPKDAFLTIMPKCLSSSSHASIVYDFLDLMISVASHAQSNHLNGKKVAKMASIWAFRNVPDSQSAFFDATLETESSFLEGLDAWKKTCNGLFHLLLSFLRAMLPDTEAETLNLPKTLQSLLITSSYPPPDNTDSMKSVITIPCVHVRSTRKSRDPYELISKVRHSLSFEKKDAFLSIENFTILKNIFQKPSTAEIVATLSEESRRVLARLTDDSVPSEFDLYPGWARLSNSKEDSNIPLYTEVSITSVTLQDYFIWTWLSSLGSDQNSSVKSLFGRSLVVEAGLRGFQKWMVLTETTISSEEYISKFQSIKHEKEYAKPTVPLPNKSKPVSTVKVPPVKKSHPLPPPPSSEVTRNNRLPPTPSQSPLPDVNFANEQFSLEDKDLANFYPENDLSPSSNYSNGLTQQFTDQLFISQKKVVNRPRPPPLESPERDTFVPKRDNYGFPSHPQHGSDQMQIFSENNRHEIPPANERSAQKQHTNDFYVEPYDAYTTKFDRSPQSKSEEPFDNYEIPVLYQQGPPRSSDKVINQKGATQSKIDKVNQRRKETPQSHTPKQSLHEDYELPPLPQNPKVISSSRNSARIYEDLPSMKANLNENTPHPKANTDWEADTTLKQNVEPQRDYHYSESHQRGHFIDEHENANPTPEFSHANPSFSHQDSNNLMTNEITDSEKKKKKKKKKSKKIPGELQAMMADLPDGPPPPLPPMDEMSTLTYQGNEEHYVPAQQNMKSMEIAATESEVSHYERLPAHLRPKIDDSTRGVPGEDYLTPRDNSHWVENTSPYPERPQGEEFYLPAPTHDINKSRSASGFSFESGSSLRQTFDREAAAPRADDASSGGSSAGHEKNRVPPPDGNYFSVHPKEHVSRIADEDYRTHNIVKGNDSSDYKPTTPQPTRHHIAPADNNNPSSHKKDRYHNEGRMDRHYDEPPSRSHHGVSKDREWPSQAPREFEQSNINDYNNRPMQDYRGVNANNVQQAHSHSQLTHQRHAPVMPPAKEHIVSQQPPPQVAHTQTYDPHPHHAPHENRPANPSRYHAPHHNPTYPQGQAMPPPAMVPQQPHYYQPQQPHGYYPPPQPGYGYAPPPGMYYPPPGGSYGPNYSHQAAPPAKPKPSVSELTMMNMPAANAFKKNTKPNKANLRAALNQGGFGI